MKKILVAGATGYLGKYTVKAAKQAGYHVKALVRDERKLDTEGRFGEPAARQYVDEVHRGEVTKPETLVGACDGMDAVFSSIGMTRQKEAFSFMNVDYRGNSNLLREAIASEAVKFMYISVINPEKFDGIVPEKERFVAELEKAPIEAYVIRSSGFYSDMSEYLRMAKKGRVYLVNHGAARINPIHGSDLARFCMEVLDQEPGEYEVGGPKVYAHREIAEIAFELCGKPFRSLSLPYGLVRFLIHLVRPFNKNLYELASFLATAAATDAVGRSYGTVYLDAYFEQLLEQRV